MVLSCLWTICCTLEYTNKVRIIELNAATNRFERTGQIDHPYPTTKIQWLPDKVFFDTYQIILPAIFGCFVVILIYQSLKHLLL